MGRVTRTINENQQIEITIDQPGKYFFQVRELPKKRKLLLVVRTNRRPAVDVKTRGGG